MRTISFFTCLLFVLFFQSCSKENNPKIEEAFAEYVEQFYIEAEKRGADVKREDFNSNIQFGNTESDVAGYCSYITFNIVIDENVWNRYNDLQREYLIYHEMGHCILARSHRNDGLETGECASIMAGGGSECRDNVFSKTLWRDYYLDELFDENIAKPDWYRTELETDVKETVFTAERDLRNIATFSFGDFDSSKNYEIIADFKAWNTYFNNMSMNWGEFSFRASRNTVVIGSTNGNNRFFRNDYPVDFDTQLRFVQLDDVHYFIVNDMMFYIDGRIENPFRSIQFNISDLPTDEPVKTTLVVNELN